MLWKDTGAELELLSMTGRNWSRMRFRPSDEGGMVSQIWNSHGVIC